MFFFAGEIDELGGRVMLYCPKCQDVYYPKSSVSRSVDGAFFGTGFPHVLLMVHPEHRPKPPEKKFIPK